MRRAREAGERGERGACTVIMNGFATRSCVMPIAATKGARIVTLEGLGTIEKPHPLQKAFIAEQAAQCGYCINGMIMAAATFLDREPHPSRDGIKQALDANLCRYGTHYADRARRRAPCPRMSARP